MKKSALPLALLLLGVTLSGCPVYDTSNAGCYSDFDCAYGYVCDGNSLTCVSVQTSSSCGQPSDCGKNETCSHSGICVSGSCHFASVGCVQGYDCSADSGTWACVKAGESTGTAGAPAGGAGEANAGAPPASAGAPTSSTGGAPEPASAAGAGG